MVRLIKREREQCVKLERDWGYVPLQKLREI